MSCVAMSWSAINYSCETECDSDEEPGHPGVVCVLVVSGKGYGVLHDPSAVHDGAEVGEDLLLGGGPGVLYVPGELLGGDELPAPDLGLIHRHGLPLGGRGLIADLRDSDGREGAPQPDRHPVIDGVRHSVEAEEETHGDRSRRGKR